ncbi:hypothetical protein HK101_001251 [Irineochytrium annulatum]|nr:hypothetical protein HK101_001251 [Irineochytrium annulatum]
MGSFRRAFPPEDNHRLARYLRCLNSARKMFADTASTRGRREVLQRAREREEHVRGGGVDGLAADALALRARRKGDDGTGGAGGRRIRPRYMDWNRKAEIMREREAAEMRALEEAETDAAYVNGAGGGHSIAASVADVSDMAFPSYSPPPGMLTRHHYAHLVGSQSQSDSTMPVHAKQRTTRVNMESLNEKFKEHLASALASFVADLPQPPKAQIRAPPALPIKLSRKQSGRRDPTAECLLRYKIGADPDPTSAPAAPAPLTRPGSGPRIISDVEACAIRQSLAARRQSRESDGGDIITPRSSTTFREHQREMEELQRSNGVLYGQRAGDDGMDLNVQLRKDRPGTGSTLHGAMHDSRPSSGNVVGDRPVRVGSGRSVASGATDKTVRGPGVGMRKNGLIVSRFRPLKYTTVNGSGSSHFLILEKSASSGSLYEPKFS